MVTCQVHPALVKRVKCTVRFSFLNFLGSWRPHPAGTWQYRLVVVVPVMVLRLPEKFLPIALYFKYSPVSLAENDKLWWCLLRHFVLLSSLNFLTNRLQALRRTFSKFVGHVWHDRRILGKPGSWAGHFHHFRRSHFCQTHLSINLMIQMQSGCSTPLLFDCVKHVHRRMNWRWIISLSYPFILHSSPFICTQMDG